MVASWAAEEMKGADLGDERLNHRMHVILDQLAAHPTASIPAACGGRAELAAAYRFFDNKKVTFEEVLHPLHAFTPQGTPLGTVRASYWTRDEPPPATNAAEKRAALRAQPMEEKESFRWIETLRQAREEAQRLDHTRIVCVADSEADIDELLAEARASIR